MTWISPIHYATGPIPDDLDFKIDLFLARVDGWHLEIADRCINGWQVDGTECINGPHPKTGGTAHNIPDSGWAVLQIVLNYFEIIGLFKCFVKNKDSGVRFKRGVLDVFPAFRNHNPDIADILWQDLRNGLYHAGIKGGRVVIQHTVSSEAMTYDPSRELLIIDPHEFVRELRRHLKKYSNRLKDPDETGLRTKFEAAYYIYYK
ncbi:MAG: hypothetical protein JXJ20_13920 [Anaerolineae bacterium]|nr:hypothetical protein [Anaerolineae bacterium]